MGNEKRVSEVLLVIISFDSRVEDGMFCEFAESSSIFIMTSEQLLSVFLKLVEGRMMSGSYVGNEKRASEVLLVIISFDSRVGDGMFCEFAESVQLSRLEDILKKNHNNTNRKNLHYQLEKFPEKFDFIWKVVASQRFVYCTK